MNTSQNNEKLNKNPVIDDNELIKFFIELLTEKKIQFINQIGTIDLQNPEFEDLKAEEYKKVSVTENKNNNQPTLSKILSRFIGIEEKKKEKVQLIKQRKFVLQKLWPYFVRNAIKLLRSKDPRDKGEFKIDFGVKNLTDYFGEFSKFEELLYGIDEYYREHTLHVFRVYILGEYIYRKIYKTGYFKVNVFEKLKEIKIEKTEKEAMWCIIALCHDLGYPLKKLDKLNKKLSKILEFFGTSHFQRVRYSLPFEGAILDKFILKIISSKLEKVNNLEYNIKVQSKFYTKYSNSYEKLDHGLMSCILLMKNLVYFKETDYKSILKQKDNDQSKFINIIDDAKQYLIRREILRAIASHDNEDIYHIDMDTFSFLLIICDEIQEWSRPIAKRRFFYDLEPENTQIIITNFNEYSIEISIKIELTDDELKDYSKKKFQKFVRLLRSAVHSDYRTFDFKLYVENGDKLAFLFEYPSPSKYYHEKIDRKESYLKPIVKKFDNDVEDPDFDIYSIIEY